MDTTTGNETNTMQARYLGWLALVKRAVILRATIVAVVIGSLLTLVNQSDWITGNEPAQLLQLVLAFITPFAVVTVAQVAGLRQAQLDIDRHGSAARREGFVATAASHGIPSRGLVIGLVFGSLSAIIVLTNALLQTGNFATVSVVPMVQAYVLPLLFGMLSQAISYRDFSYQSNGD